MRVHIEEAQLEFPLCPETVVFTEQAIRDHLDACIRLWRERLVRADGTTVLPLQAASYIDAYQSMRVALFGDILPVEED